jgi:hypothetical protein
MASGNIPAELAAWKSYLVPIVAPPVISRVPAVHTHSWDGFYTGPFPLILVRPYQSQTVVLDIGQPGRRGQDAAHPGIYTLTILDAIDSTQAQTPGGDGLVAAAERDIEALWTAIDNSFDVVANWPGLGAFIRLGFATRIRFADPFQVAEDSTTRVVATAFISSVGLPHLGTLI